MDEVHSALWVDVIIGSIVTVATRPLSDWIYRRIVDAWNARKEAA